MQTDWHAVFIHEDDRRIHGKFNQTDHSDRTYQQHRAELAEYPERMELGRLIRKVFVPEEGYVFLDARLFADRTACAWHICPETQQLIREAYREAKDIHRITASQVFHTPFDEVTDLQRRNAKAVNFGIVYGISSFGLSQDLSITRKEAVQIY
ncbi:MAG: DNA polymerase [Coprococcus sp.]